MCMRPHNFDLGRIASISTTHSLLRLFICLSDKKMVTRSHVNKHGFRKYKTLGNSTSYFTDLGILGYCHFKAVTEKAVMGLYIDLYTYPYKILEMELLGQKACMVLRF